MARLPKLILPGEAHYVGLRGRGAAPVLAAPADRELWRDLALQVLRDTPIALHAYSLMPDAVHLLLTPAGSGELSRAMQAIGRAFGPRYNRLHTASGSPWDGRFRTAPLQAAVWLLPLMYLLDELPVRMGLVDRPEHYAWSSAAHYCGLTSLSGLTPPESVWAMGNTPFEREASYRRGLQDGLSAGAAESLERRLARGWPLGDAHWLEQIAPGAKRPLRPRRAGRPRRRPAPQ